MDLPADVFDFYKQVAKMAGVDIETVLGVVVALDVIGMKIRGELDVKKDEEE